MRFIDKLLFLIVFFTLSFSERSFGQFASSLDPTFNGNGIFLPASPQYGRAYTSAIQADGKILFAGQCSPTTSFCIVRLNANGSYDNTFNSTGKVPLPPFGSTSFGAALEVYTQPDGKIVVAGGCDAAFCITRLNPNGSLDATFATTGFQIEQVNGLTSEGSAAVLQADGKHIVGGHCFNPFRNYCLIRLNPNGGLDTTFNGSGTLLLNRLGFVEDVLVQPDGKIVVVGSCNNLGTVDYCVIRLLSNGQLDNTFALGGQSVTPFNAVINSNDLPSEVALQPDGKLVVTGHCGDGYLSFDFCALRLDQNGALDPTFGTNGQIVIARPSGSELAFDMVMQPSGKIVIGGWCLFNVTPSKNGDFCAIRLLSNGTLDLSFAASGMFSISMSNIEDQAWTMSLQPDNKIVMAGRCVSNTTADFCAIRLEGCANSSSAIAAAKDCVAVVTDPPHDDPLDIMTDEHYQCYQLSDEKVETLATFTGIDQFEDVKQTLLRPVMLCNPTKKVHGDSVFEIQNFDRHLVCYERSVDDDFKSGKVVEISNQFETRTVTVKNRSVFCVPSTKKVME